MIVVFSLLLLLILGLGLYYYLRLVVLARLPHNAPRNIDKSDTRPRIVFAGDSNTHGNMGYNWVNDIEHAHTYLQVINAGVNADLAITLKRRLDEIIDLKPILVTILIGTNDVNATMSKDNYKRYLTNGKIRPSDVVNEVVFEDVIFEIVTSLKKRTDAQICLISIPLIGEDLNHPVNQKADNYSKIIQRIARETKADFLDFRALQKGKLLESKVKPRYEGYFRKMQNALVLHYYLGWSWDRISYHHGTQFTHDLLHQNKQSAFLLKGLIENWIIKNRTL